MKVNNYQVWAMELFGNACYAACISYICGNDSPLDITRDILNGVGSSYIEHSGFVSKPVEYYNSIAKEWGKPCIRDVEKPGISSLSELPDDKDYVVEYQYGKQSHFVVANRNGVVFDPYGNSNTVRNGKPVSWRKYVF